MSTHMLGDRTSAPIAVRLMATAAVMLVMVAGIFVFGRLADDDRTAMLYTGAWFGVVLIGGALLTRQRPSLRLPLGAGFVVVVAAATVVLGLPMLVDDEVNERVVTGAPATAAPSAGAREDASRAGRASRAPAGNVQVAGGRFGPLSHPGSGAAAVVELPSGERMLTLTEFETDNGPDLRVYLSTGNPAGGGELGDFEDLGGLKGNKGSQQYEIPKGVDVARFSNVVIWCRAFSVGFTSAPLAKP